MHGLEQANGHLVYTVNRFDYFEVTRLLQPVQTEGMINRNACPVTP